MTNEKKITKNELELMKKMAVYAEMPLETDKDLSGEVERLKKSTECKNEKIIKQAIKERDQIREKIGHKIINSKLVKKVLEDMEYPEDLIEKVLKRMKKELKK